MRSNDLTVCNLCVGHADQSELCEPHCSVVHIAKRNGLVHFVTARKLGCNRRGAAAITPFVDPRRSRVETMQLPTALLKEQQFVANDLRNGPHTMQKLHAQTLVHICAEFVGTYS